MKTLLKNALPVVTGVVLLLPLPTNALTLSELVNFLIVSGFISPDKMELAQQTVANLEAQQPTITAPQLTRNLYLGVKGNDVASLQRFLQSTGDFTYPDITQYYGPATAAAVQRYQCREMQICSGSPHSNGYGVVGPKTRGSIAARTSTKTTVTTVSPAPTSPMTPPVVTSVSPAGGGGTPSSVPTSCIWNGTAVAHGAGITAYQRATVPYGSVCVSQVRACTNGTLSGSYENVDCVVDAVPQREQSTVVNMQSELTGFRNMYAPFVMDVGGKKRMWMCGWKTDADPDNYWAARNAGTPVGEIEGPDKIWYSDFVDGAWTSPTLSFKTVGYQVCDPSIVQVPGDISGETLYMYYTILDLQYAGIEEVKHPWTGFAVSHDGGKTWVDDRILIGQENGADGWGAWSPSALRVGNEIWVYFNTGNQDMTVNATFRQRFALDGKTRLGAPEPLRYGPGLALTPGTEATLLANLDIQRDGSRYIMLAGTYDIFNIVRLASFDGLTWYQAEENHPILVHSSGPRIATPFLDITGQGTYSVYFGNSEPGDVDYKYIFRWDFKIVQ